MRIEIKEYVVAGPDSGPYGITNGRMEPYGLYK
jgi:hypothetical protein